MGALLVEIVQTESTTKGIEKSVLCVLAHMVNSNDASRRCWPAIDEIAHRSGWSTGAVSKAIKSLAEKGIIETTKRGKGYGQGRGRTSNVYVVLAIFPPMKEKDLKEDLPHLIPSIDSTSRDQEGPIDSTSYPIDSTTCSLESLLDSTSERLDSTREVLTRRTGNKKDEQESEQGSLNGMVNISEGSLVNTEQGEKSE